MLMVTEIIEGINPKDGSTYYNVIYRGVIDSFNLVYRDKKHLPKLGDVVEELPPVIDNRGVTNRQFRKVKAIEA